MKSKMLLLASGVALSALFAGCNTVTPDQMNQSLANAATLIANGCKIVQPTLSATAVATANAPAALAATANGVFCAANEAAVDGAAAKPAAPASAPAASQ